MNAGGNYPKQGLAGYKKRDAGITGFISDFSIGSSIM
jgi:hypothetical protein